MRPGLALLLCIAAPGIVVWLTAFPVDDGSPPLRVFVASSMADVVEDLVVRWTLETGTPVEVVAGGSNHLVAQIRDGAPADAVLSADPDLLDSLTAKGPASGGHVSDRAEATRLLARNHLVVARPADGPDRSPGDLHDPALVLVACAPEVPCGAVIGERFGDLPIDSLEPSARATVTRLALSEADLGIVYATDVAAHPGLVPAWPQEPVCPCVTYAAAALTEAGVTFVGYLGSGDARAVLVGHGFALEVSQ